MADEAAAFARAIESYRAGDLDAARVGLAALLAREPKHLDGWSALGYVERDGGRAAEAAAAFERALALQPDDRRAQRGRARIALERGEADAPERYSALLRANPGDGLLLIEATHARLEAGDLAAIEALDAAAAADGAWTEGQIELARLRRDWLNDPRFDRHLGAMAQAGGIPPELWRDWAQLLAECGDHARAADIAAAARQALGDRYELRFMEAIHAGRDGQLRRAGALLATLPVDAPNLALHQAIHAIRRQELEPARTAIDTAIAARPNDVAAWGMAEFIYRALGDPRSAWLSGQDGLIQTHALDVAPEVGGRLADLLRGLTRQGVELAGQSVRGGRQTLWRLFDRAEPDLAVLRAALERAIEAYRRALPPADPAHPLLRHRNARLAITGNWSVYLPPGGRHASHVHHLGLLSSASYWVVPSGDEPGGLLELGRPPPDLNLALEPLMVVRPKVGELSLFPSYVHHGTTPFSRGERISVAFDVAAAA